MSDSKKIFEGERVLVLERDRWQYVERKKGKSAVAVIAVTSDDKLILIEQHRKPVDARVIDWPAGLVGDEDGDESDPAATARRELEEETGYACQRVELLATSPTSPGITSEIVRLYRAYGVEKRGVGEENITVHTIPRKEIEAWLKRKSSAGVLIDLKVWAGLYFA